MEIVMLVDKHEFKAGQKVEVDENNKNLRQRADWYLANNFAQICNGEDGCKDCKDKKNKETIGTENVESDVVLFTFENTEGETVEVKTIKDIKKDQVVSLLEAIDPKVEFNVADNKETLFSLYLETLKG